MAIIQVPVTVLDERCASCQCLQIDRDNILYGNDEVINVTFKCGNIHMCTYIRNRIVRGSPVKNDKEEKKNE